jgi:hypothetical protein
MHAAGGRPADQQRDVEALALHLGGHMHHLVERGRDQAGEADDIDASLLGRLQYLARRNHDAEIDHLIIVACQHDAHDVLTDIVDIALDRRHQDLAGALAFAHSVGVFLRFHEGQEVGHGLLHHAGRFDDLRQEHFAGAKKISDDIHPVHQRAFDHMKRTGRGEPRFLGVYFDMLGDAIDEGMRQALLDRPASPGEILHLRFLRRRALESLGQGQQPFRRILAAIEDHILARFAQFRLDRFIDGELAGIDNPHVHAALDGVIEKHGMHRFADRLVAAKRE